jgi:hypothetical protein
VHPKRMLSKIAQSFTMMIAQSFLAYKSGLRGLILFVLHDVVHYKILIVVRIERFFRISCQICHLEVAEKSRREEGNTVVRQRDISSDFRRSLPSHACTSRLFMTICGLNAVCVDTSTTSPNRRLPAFGSDGQHKVL